MEMIELEEQIVGVVQMEPEVVVRWLTFERQKLEITEDPVLSKEFAALAQIIVMKELFCPLSFQILLTCPIYQIYLNLELQSYSFFLKIFPLLYPQISLPYALF